MIQRLTQQRRAGCRDIAAALLVASVFVLSPGSLACAQQSNAPQFSAAAVDQKEATEIFNGQSLQGWHIMDKPAEDKQFATTDNFFVRDKAIVCRQFGNRHGGMLISDKQYDNFELELDFRVDWGCDSGVILRCNESGEGIQIMIDYLKTGCVGFPFGQGTGGFISRPIELVKQGNTIVATDRYDATEIDGLVEAIDAKGWNSMWKHNDWNHLKVRCVGTQPKIKTWINDVCVMEMDGSTYRARKLKDEKEKNWAAPPQWNSQHIQKLTGGKGNIALQVHPGGRWARDGSAQFRAIQIREIKK